MANRTSRNILPRPMTSRTSDVELHSPASLFDRPLAMTLRTLTRSFDVAVTMAISADIAPRNIQLHHAAADRRPERHVDLVFQVAARLRTLVGRFTAPAAGENVGENILEPATAAAGCFPSTAAARALEQIGKIKAPEINVARSSRLPPSARKASGKI